MVKKDRKQVKILDIALDSTNKTQVLREVRVKIATFERKDPNYRPFYIVTPNPEIALEALKDKNLALILNSADFTIPDGIGLSQAAFFLSLPDYKFLPLRIFILPFEWFYTVFLTWFKKERLFERLNIIKGRKLFTDLIFLANKKGWRVVLVGSAQGSAQKAASIIKNSYKKVKIFPFSGPALNREGVALNQEEKKAEKELLDSINQISPHLVFVGFGAPKQEKWLYRNLDSLKIGGAMVVGGTFDYVSGKLSLPPRFLEKLGLEWFWRLLVEPKRWLRIFRAVFIFPTKVISFKLKKGLDRTASF